MPPCASREEACRYRDAHGVEIEARGDARFAAQDDAGRCGLRTELRLSSGRTTQDWTWSGRRPTGQGPSVVGMRINHVAARRTAVPGALLLTVSFALAGCSPGADTVEEGPITSRIKAIDGDDELTRAQNTRYEEAIAACMKAKGFEYTPVPMGDSYSSESWSEEDWDPVADAKEHGYSITPAGKDALAMQYSLGDEAPEETAAEEEVPSDVADDPNDAYYSTLSASDQTAYDEALYGPMVDDTAEVDTIQEYDWTTNGCSGVAAHEVYDTQTDEQDTSVLEDFYAYAADKTDDDSRVVEANAAWVSCMAGKGYDFADPDAARASIQQRFDDLMGIDPTSEVRVEPDLDGVSDEVFAALHDDEMATSLADAECIVSAGVRDAFDRAWADADAKFYDSHKTEVDAWFAAQEARLYTEG